MLNRQTHLKVLLVDDHPLFRDGLGLLLDRLECQVTTYNAAGADEAIRLALENTPEIAIVDLSLGDGLSLDLIKKMRSSVPSTAILVVSMHDERLYAERTLAAGASGYVMKQSAAKSILHALQAVIDGKIWLSDEMRGVVFGKLTDRTEAKPKNISALSDRELEVFKLIGDGLKNSVISKKLQISLSTVETHRANIKKKLGIDKGEELQRLAYSYFQV